MGADWEFTGPFATAQEARKAVKCNAKKQKADIHVLWKTLKSANEYDGEREYDTDDEEEECNEEKDEDEKDEDEKERDVKRVKE